MAIRLPNLTSVSSYSQAILAIIHGYQIILKDDEKDVIVLEKVESFAEETVPRFNDRQFRQHFRMSPSTFEDFLTKLHAVSGRVVAAGNPEIVLEKQGMITLWCLSNIECFRSVADRFGVTKSTCWFTLYRTCHKILEINRQFKIICWPSRERAINIMEYFRTINGFEVSFPALTVVTFEYYHPKNHPNSYCNRKNFHSVLLQAVCDNRKLFTHVYTGEPGSIHDSNLFQKSDLFQGIERGNIKFPNNSHMLGDLAYKLAEYLMVGFKNNANLSDRQKNFNKKISEIRVYIENALALLKGRFRRLKFMETIRLDLISLLIISACILHNICILNGDEADDLLDLQQELEDERQLNNGDIYDNPRENNQLAQAKRSRIMNHLEM